MPPMALQPASYKLKTISFGPSRRAVRIVIQNENGPCPLLAIANVLLLRNAVQLPAGAPDVTQERLVSLMAGHLLDVNSEERLRAASPEYRANVRRRRLPLCLRRCVPLQRLLRRCHGRPPAVRWGERCLLLQCQRRAQRWPALEPTRLDRAWSACCTWSDCHAVQVVASV